MQKKSQDFSLEKAQALAESPAGQQLLSILQQSDTQKIQQAMEQLNAGNLSQAGKILQQLLSSDEAKRLLKELER